MLEAREMNRVSERRRSEGGASRSELVSAPLKHPAKPKSGPARSHSERRDAPPRCAGASAGRPEPSL